MTIFILVFFILLLAYGYIINRYTKGWNSLQPFNSLSEQTSIKISVIIAARNEEKNIDRLLASIKEQSYSPDDFEVIIINDFSSDSTLDKLKAINPEPLTLKIIDMAAIVDTELDSSKKKALETGIAASTGDIIVTSDADCTFSRDWLKAVASFYQESDAICIAGPVMIISNRSMGAMFQAMDFLTLQGITAAAIHQDVHVMANGANFSYKKTAYEQVNGFRNIDSIPSGDDMLLMQKIRSAYPGRIKYLKSRSAIVKTDASPTWKDFFNQRIRWAGKTKHYDSKQIMSVMILVWLFNLCFLVITAVSFINPYYVFLLVLFLVAKILIEYPFVNQVAQFFDQQKLMRFFPLFQPLHIMYTSIAGLLGMIGQYTWKNRTVKIQ